MDRLARIAPLSGLAAAVLFGIGSALWALDQPARDAGTEEIVAFYKTTDTRILIGGTLSIISLIFLVWFGAVLHERIAAGGGPGSNGLALVAFGGTIVTAAVGLGAETINMAGALSAGDGQLTGDTAQIYFDVSYAFGAPAAGVALAMIAAPVGIVSLNTGALLKPATAWLTLLLAVLLLTPVMLTEAFGAVFFVGILALVALSVRLYREPDTRGTPQRP